MRSGEIPKDLDLFAGCGGLSFGYQCAALHIAGAIEFDPMAAQTH